MLFRSLLPLLPLTQSSIPNSHSLVSLCSSSKAGDHQSFHRLRYYHRLLQGHTIATAAVAKTTTLYPYRSRRRQALQRSVACGGDRGGCNLQFSPAAADAATHRPSTPTATTAVARRRQALQSNERVAAMELQRSFDGCRRCCVEAFDSATMKQWRRNAARASRRR